MCGRRLPGLSGRLLVVIMVLASAGCIQSPAQNDASDAPPDPPDPELIDFYSALAGDPAVTFKTGHGEVQLLVYESLMPTTAGRFLELVHSGFYDETIVHRVVDDFVIQGGDPSGSGLLGSGQTIPFESHPDLQFAHGALGLARDVDPDSGDSQWFITEKPQPHLHAPGGVTGTVFGSYAMYGQVYAGMDVVRAIAAVETVPGADRPTEDVILETATVGPPPAIDLLHLPLLVATHSGEGHTIDVVHPLRAFTDRAFPLTVFVEPIDDDTSPPPVIDVTLLQGAHRVEARLEPLRSDPAVYHAEVALPRPGAWTINVVADHDEASDTIQVVPWHDDYAAFDRADTSAAAPTTD